MGKYDPFVNCEKCSAVTRKSNMARHMKIKHKSVYKGRMFYEKITCYCNKCFSPTHLKSHWKKHHQDHVSLQHYKWEIKMRMTEAGKSFSQFSSEFSRRRKVKELEKQLKNQITQMKNFV